MNTGLATYHILKAWPKFFEAVREGRKTFELRRDDRPGGFNVGDFLQLVEWEPGIAGWTGRTHICRVSYVMRSGEIPGLEQGFVVLGLSQ